MVTEYLRVPTPMPAPKKVQAKTNFSSSFEAFLASNKQDKMVEPSDEKKDANSDDPEANDDAAEVDKPQEKKRRRRQRVMRICPQPDSSSVPLVGHSFDTFIATHKSSAANAAK